MWHGWPRGADALDHAYRCHGGAVFALALRVIGDRGQAEDVTQTVFTTLWAEADRFGPQSGPLRSYLLTMAHRRSVDVLRSGGPRRHREARGAGLASAPYDLEHEVWDRAVGERVRSALDSLGPGERHAIELAYFGGHTCREVASLLGEAETTVKSRIRYGLRRLHMSLVDRGASGD
jgi:RNA polymerase sigma-70 factor (ECF subfamily)